ncbi:MAG: glycosyltransferase family 2 protein [Gammaproteobacteria bacterium]
MPPVVLIIFNRPDLVERQVESLHKLPLQQLFVIGDGPRDGTADGEKCRDARAAVESVRWPCDVQTNYAERNMGCAKRIVTGLDWVFSHVDRAIILEDDCLPHADFFRFCEELLARYKHDDTVMQICGTNLLEDINDRYSYRFSRHVVCWGWATWASAWACNDLAMNVSGQLIENMLENYLLGNRLAIEYWLKVLDRTRRGELDAWDYPWQLSVWRHDGVAILPNRNLVSNAGFREDATHTRNAGASMANLPVAELEFPLQHPPGHDYGFQYDAQFIEQFFRPRGRSGRSRSIVDRLMSRAKRLFD